jgi:surface antigen
LSRIAQALLERFLVSLRSVWLKMAMPVVVSLALQACAAGGFSLKQAEVDRSFYTSDIPASAKNPVDAERLSDQATIRDAISSADIEGLGGQALPWANSQTGSRGSITDLAEYRDQSLLCRSFTTTRESFDGVRLFKGEACLADSGGWRMLDFEAL